MVSSPSCPQQVTPQQSLDYCTGLKCLLASD